LSNITQELKELREKESPFIILEDKEAKTLQFDPAKTKIEDKEFGEGDQKRQVKLVEYRVTEPGADRGEKILSMARINAEIIQEFLDNGQTLLQVKRRGKGRQTRYTFIPIQQ